MVIEIWDLEFICNLVFEFWNLIVRELEFIIFVCVIKEINMSYIPHEFTIGSVYFPPLLIAAFLGVVLASLTAIALNRYRLSRFLFYPPLVFVALTVIYTGLIGAFIIPV